MTSYLIYNGLLVEFQSISVVDYESADQDQMPRFVAPHLDQRRLKFSPYITNIASKPNVITLLAFGFEAIEVIEAPVSNKRSIFGSYGKDNNNICNIKLHVRGSSNKF